MVFQGLGAYCVSKTALLGLTKVLAQECGNMGVRVNSIAPGIIKTRFSEAVSRILQKQLLAINYRQPRMAVVFDFHSVEKYLQFPGCPVHFSA